MPVLQALLIAALVTLAGRPAPARAASAASSATANVTASAASTVAAAPSGTVATTASHPRAGLHLLVTFRATATAADRQRVIDSVGGWVDGVLPHIGVTRIALPGDANDAFTDGPAVAATVAKDPAVASAELDHTVRAAFDPNDQYYWTDPYTGLGQWGIRKAYVNAAWDRVRGSAAITVAVVDTGVDPNHPDLAGALVPGTTFVSQPSPGCDPNATTDDDSHGTHVAGIVGAVGNNGIGIAGVAFGVRIMPVKALDCTGTGSLSDVANGIIWAADHGARVVNLSLGSPYDSSALRSAVTYAEQKNALVVSAAGNCGEATSDCTSLDEVEYPAAYPDVLAVGATDTNDSVAYFSTVNSTVDVVAPGRKIVSTTPTYATYLSARGATLSYAAFSGTSQATPFVSGVAALVLSGEPQLTYAQLMQRIESSADQMSGPQGTRNDQYGYGRVDALKAVTAGALADHYGATYDASALPRSVGVGAAYTARVILTNTSNFTWRQLDPASTHLVWSWMSATGQTVAGLGASVPMPADVLPGATATVSFPVVGPSSAGSYLFRLDLVRSGTLFSSKGVPPGSVVTIVGTGLGATYSLSATSATSSAQTFNLGATSVLNVVLTNAGTTTWPAAGAAPVHLSYHWLRSGAVTTWDGARAPLPGDVPSGGTVTMPLAVLSPAQPGAYTLRVDLVQEGVAWFSGIGVTPLDLAVNVVSPYVATYATGALPILLPGGRTLLPVTVTNTGTATWPSSGPTPVHLAAHVVDQSGNVVIWDGARTSFTADVAPGAAVQTTAIVDAPLAAGPYTVKLDLVREGVAWFSSLGVTPAAVSLAVSADHRATILPGGPITVSRASPVTQVTLTNTGIATWTTGGAAPLDVAAHWYDAAGNVLVWDGPRTPLPASVAPGQSVTVIVQLGSPPAGAAFVAVDVVSEGVAWFGQGGLRPVTLAP